MIGDIASLDLNLTYVYANYSKFRLFNSSPHTHQRKIIIFVLLLNPPVYKRNKEVVSYSV